MPWAASVLVPATVMISIPMAMLFLDLTVSVPNQDACLDFLLELRVHDSALMAHQIVVVTPMKDLLT